MIIISHLIIIIIILSSSSTSYPACTPYRSGNKNKKVSYKKCQYNMLQPIQNFFQIKRKKVKLALSGLHSSGKTTILYKLTLGEVVTTVPTIGFNIESVDISRRHSVTAWDIGGDVRCVLSQDIISLVWTYYSSLLTQVNRHICKWPPQSWRTLRKYAWSIRYLL